MVDGRPPLGRPGLPCFVRSSQFDGPPLSLLDLGGREQATVVPLQVQTRQSLFIGGLEFEHLQPVQPRLLEQLALLAPGGQLAMIVGFVDHRVATLAIFGQQRIVRRANGHFTGREPLAVPANEATLPTGRCIIGVASQRLFEQFAAHFRGAVQFRFERRAHETCRRAAVDRQARFGGIGGRRHKASQRDERGRNGDSMASHDLDLQNYIACFLARRRGCPFSRVRARPIEASTINCSPPPIPARARCSPTRANYRGPTIADRRQSRN